MDYSVFSDLLGQLGFPIAMCIYMMYSNNKTVKSMTDAVNDNTNVLSKLLEHVRGGGEFVE